jgi:dihydroflavonol-4-reductase
VSRVFVTGGSGVVGRALVERLVAGGDEVVALARSRPAEETVRSLGATPVHGDLFDEDALASAMAGCTVIYNVAGINTLCVDDPGPMLRTNVEGPPAVVRAAARAGVGRFVHTSSAATIGEASGVVGREDTPHRGWYLSSYERSKTEGERAVFEAGREAGVEVVCVNPSSVQGPGRSGGTARFLLAYLDGRLKVFVPTNVSLVDIADCAEGHVLAAQRGVAGERYLLNSIALSITEALALAGEVAGVEGRPRLVPRQVATAGAWVVEHGSRLARRKPPVCREMVRTLLHGHIYDGSRAERDLGLRYTEPRETLRKTVDWARAEGLLRTA